jgi:hypothetical protein
VQREETGGTKRRHETGDAKRRQVEQRNKTGSTESIQEVLLETKSVER